MATSRLIGGPALRARLAALAKVPPEFAGEWAAEAKDRIVATKPQSNRPASSKFSTKVSERRAGVYGAFWWIFVDRGTKAHDIVARRAKALRFEAGGQTIFARKVQLRRMRRRPFITKAAQEALHGGADFIIKTWNGRRRKRGLFQ
ncbi:MAG TPA: hypothetical protein VJ141_05245 [Candidatus Limnocylindrales bacterium]|nr:hypothetical protein [Candidatus Limnocylindrales bacterium]